MIEKFSNHNVYDFLEEECRHNDYLWRKYGEGIAAHTRDLEFWEQLGEELDCFRICEECGSPMIEGYVVDGDDTYCSEACLHKHVSEEEYERLYDNGNGDTYWTTWYEDSKTYINKRT